ncbi:MAG: dipicolinate synthase subunit B [Faecalibacillus sp.]
MCWNKIKGLKIGVGVSGSFCSFSRFMGFLKELVLTEADIYVFLSFKVQNYDTRFYQSNQFINDIEHLIGKKVITDEVEAERFGPQIPLDLMVVYPCSGNTLAKLSHGLNDNAVTMAVKSTLRNGKNIVLGICSNDVLGVSGKNMMDILNKKHYYLVPMYQDDIIKKPNSMLAAHHLIIPTIELAFKDQQIQPLFITND